MEVAGTMRFVHRHSVVHESECNPMRIWMQSFLLHCDRARISRKKRLFPVKWRAVTKLRILRVEPCDPIDWIPLKHKSLQRKNQVDVAEGK